MMRLRLGALGLFILVALSLPALLHRPDRVQVAGQDYLREEIQLNRFTGSKQDRAALAMDEDGQMLAVWESRRQEGGSYGVFARRVDALGRARGGEIHVNEYLPGHQQHPAVALDASGPFFAWESYGQLGAGGAVLARGEGGEAALSQPSGLASLGGVAILADGRRVTVFSVAEKDGSSRIWARLASAEGEALGEPLPLSENASALDRLPTVAASDDGFRVAWSREIAGAGPVGVFTRAFDASGAPLGGEQFVSAGIEPVLDTAADGSFAMAWMASSDGGYRVEARRFSADGSPRGEIIVAGAGESQNGAALAMRADGSFALAWNELSEDGRDSDLFARLYHADGAPAGEAFAVTAHREKSQELSVASPAARLAYGEDGRLALAWNGDSGHGDGSAVNLTLLRPVTAGLLSRAAERWQLAWSELAERIHPAPEGEMLLLAEPRMPPVYEAPEELDVVLEGYFPGDGFRDEGFQGFSNTGWTPPDPHGAAGVSHVVGMVNGGIACWTKDGTQLWQQSISGPAFWPGADSFVFDPEVLYDPHSGRFMAMACERGDDNHSYFDFAVSKDGAPETASDWWKYRLDVTALAGNDIDSPNMAVTDDAVYLTADFFSPDTYLVYILDKTSVLGGGAPVATHYLHTGTQSMGLPMMFTAGRKMVMMETSENTNGNTIKFYAVMDPLGSPYLTTSTVTVDTYWRPIYTRSLGTSTQVITFEARLWSAMEIGGSVWATHHCCPTSARQKLVARWYEIDLRGWPDSGQTPVRIQQGDVLPGGTGYASFCSISANVHGKAALNFSYSSTSSYYQMYRTLHDPGLHGPGEMSAPVLLKASGSSYSGNRWGDYSSVAVDPADNRSFWMHGEYTPGGNQWATWFGTFDPGIGTGVGEFEHFAFRSEGAWPNPSSAGTRLAFSLPGAAEVALDVFDVTGRRLRRLDAGSLGEGRHELFWDGRDARGQQVPAGVYLTRYTVAGQQMPGERVTVVR